MRGRGRRMRRPSRSMKESQGYLQPDDEKLPMRGQNGNRRGWPSKTVRGRTPLGVNHKLWTKKLLPQEQEYLNAALSGDTATLQRIIDAQEVDLNVVDSYGHTALMIAAWKDRSDAVKLLLNTGVSLNCRNHDGQTAMDKAAYWGFTDILQLLVSAGSTIDIRNNNGETPLHRAAMWGHVDAVKLLLNAKANGNEFKNQRRYTPLHFAAKHGKPDVIRVLLEAKCDPLRRDSCGRTPLELAKRNKKQEVYRLLKDWERGHEGNMCEEIYSAIMKIEKAGNWDASTTHHDKNQLKRVKQVCAFDLVARPASTDRPEPIITLALATTVDYIPCKENVLSINRQESVNLKAPERIFTVERQDGISVGFPRTNQILNFQLVAPATRSSFST